MSKVFVEERDTFLAYSLKQASEIPIHDTTRNREPRVVVGVVGLGHMAGIVQKFDTGMYWVDVKRQTTGHGIEFSQKRHP